MAFNSQTQVMNPEGRTIVEEEVNRVGDQQFRDLANNNFRNPPPGVPALPPAQLTNSEVGDLKSNFQID